MTYIFITYEAVVLFASDRFLQSYENDASDKLCNILRLTSDDWSHSRILLHKCKKGLVFFTKDSSYTRGILFDLTTFKGFSNQQDNRTIINIFQKTIKYGIRYFEKLPLASCDRELPDKGVTVIYPNPFVANHDVLKIVLDRNTSRLQKKDFDYLTVFDYATTERNKVSFTSLNKAYDEIRSLNFSNLAASYTPQKTHVRGFNSVELKHKELTIDMHVGFETWIEHYLTDVQRNFVCSNIDGPERLEGAAGTGKTLCLILRCIYLLKQHVSEDTEFHVIFFTHSLSTKERIISVFKSNWELYDLCEENHENNKAKQSIKVTTLQEWSAEHLGTNSIAESEYLDKDAANSKLLQIYYIEEAYRKIKEELWDGTFEFLCSERFKNFIQYNSEENILDLLRQEIAVLIKGRASGDFDKYKQIVRPKYSLPLIEEADFKFVFLVFNKYQEALEKVGQYDSDDITLSALGQVRTPIWNRRRIRDGYDVCVIDETHLFNINELSVFHFVNKPLDIANKSSINKIIFAIDKSQATGDWGVDDISINNALKYGEEVQNKQFNTVFRSSPDIVNLAYNILSSGVAMFTTFENPLSYSSFDFVKEEEEKAIPPSYSLELNDKMAIEKGIAWAENYCSEKRVSKNNVLIIGTTDELVKQIEEYMSLLHKPFESLQSRSDERAMKKAQEGNKFIVSQIDYVGGLEFDAVIIIGVDDGRVPPSKNANSDAYHVISYAWHSKMYVAVTRAKYTVRMFGDISRGPSTLLYSSIYGKIVEYIGPDIVKES